MNISHLLYKVDDLEKAIQKFRDMGFQVEFGKKNNPYNALIYFGDKSYIELIKNMHITFLIKTLLRLFRMNEYLETSLKQEKIKESFFRVAFHMEDIDKLLLKRSYKEILNCSTFYVPVSRRDIHGNMLKSKCLLPSNAIFPFFNTNLVGGVNWDVKHPNKINGIRKLIYSATPCEKKFFEQLPIDRRLEVTEGGRGIENIEFHYSQSQKSALKYRLGEWKLI